ncbi:aspartate kinase [Kordia sp. TARA_039_SRF]|nr:aspartate kinase [Kordia sp. TARA_039_SRF]
MKILKFGGTSVGSVKGLLKISEIISQTSGRKIIVCSAMSGVTDILLNLTKHVKARDELSISRCIDTLRQRHLSVIQSLFSQEDVKLQMKDFISESLNCILKLSKQTYSEDIECEIITYGERLLTQIYTTYLNSIGIKNVLLDVREFMQVDKVHAPDIAIISEKLISILEKNKEVDLFITQGFIRMTSNGELRHLQRGGSDYSATLIGAALGVEEVQIWSDVDGFHNCDPRTVSSSFPIPCLSYDEAAELAYFGAKILHPRTVFPVKKLKIPLRLKDTYKSELQGTTISNKVIFSGRKAIAIKDNLLVLRMTFATSDSMKNMTAKVFDELKKKHIAIYFSHTEDNFIEVVVPQASRIYETLDVLETMASINFKKDVSIVCVVGYDQDYSKISNQKEIHSKCYINNVIRSEHDMLSTRLLINSADKEKMLFQLNEFLFPEKITL